MTSSSSLDPPEEVVRGQEREVPAKIAIALYQVVLARGHVLVVAGKDDEVVGLCEPLRGWRPVRTRAARVSTPQATGPVPASAGSRGGKAVSVRDSSVEVRTPQANGVDLLAGVPGVREARRRRRHGSCTPATSGLAEPPLPGSRRSRRGETTKGAKPRRPFGARTRTQ